MLDLIKNCWSYTFCSSIDLHHRRVPPKHNTSQKLREASDKKKHLSRPSSRHPVKGKAAALTHPKSVADELLPRQQTNFKPETFNEYLEKYYGVIDARDNHYSTDSAHSDTEVDYRDERWVLFLHLI